MSAPTVVCWGELLWDLFPDGRLLGGAPSNVAYHLAALGCSVALASRVGDDELGREAAAALTASGVDTSLLQIDPRRRTGRVEVELVAGEPSYTLVPGCAWEHIEVTDAVATALTTCRAFCYGTLSQHVETTHFERALALLPETCLRVCDPNLRPKHVDFAHLRSALAAADLVKLNQDEARIIAERAGVDDAVVWMRDKLGVATVVLTRGPRGCVVVSDSGMLEHPGFAAAPGGDNVGAGDAFLAALVHLLLLERPLDEVMRAANRYGAYLASQKGATPAIPSHVIDAVQTP